LLPVSDIRIRTTVRVGRRHGELLVQRPGSGGRPYELVVAVSIAVMNWVWANSPTSGNERLVLLALADACSRDDGTGCWPSAATIGRKASISARTVRRVIARLEGEGHVVVHRGGGRAGSTNSYTVITGLDTPDRLSP